MTGPVYLNKDMASRQTRGTDEAEFLHSAIKRYVDQRLREMYQHVSFQGKQIEAGRRYENDHHRRLIDLEKSMVDVVTELNKRARR